MKPVLRTDPYPARTTCAGQTAKNAALLTQLQDAMMKATQLSYNLTEEPHHACECSLCLCGEVGDIHDVAAVLRLAFNQLESLR